MEQGRVEEDVCRWRVSLVGGMVIDVLSCFLGRVRRRVSLLVPKAVYGFFSRAGGGILYSFSWPAYNTVFYGGGDV